MTEYIPKPDPENINSPAATPLRDAAILVAGFCGVVAIVIAILILVADWLVLHIDLKTEMRWTQAVREHVTMTENPKEFNNLFEKLSAAAGLDLKAKLVCGKDANAFALPGGVILINSEILKTVKSENGLAFVLGHEIGHVVNRDHLRGVGRLMVFALGGALINLSDYSGLESIVSLVSSHYSRQKESQADAYSLQLMQKIYGHTWGAEEFFEAMAKDETALDKTVGRFVRTHPLSSERAEAVRKSQTGEKVNLEAHETAFTEWFDSENLKRCN